MILEFPTSYSTISLFSFSANLLTELSDTLSILLFMEQPSQIWLTSYHHPIETALYFSSNESSSFFLCSFLSWLPGHHPPLVFLFPPWLLHLSHFYRLILLSLRGECWRSFWASPSLSIFLGSFFILIALTDIYILIFPQIYILNMDFPELHTHISSCLLDTSKTEFFILS